jgi:hypothetical protein
MGHHFFITASSSVTSIGILHSHDGDYQCECRLAAKASERSRRCLPTYEFLVTSDKPPPKPVFCGTKVLPALKRSN